MSSRTASSTPCPASSSASPAAAATANRTTGVARPSFNPLSTFRIRRTRAGTTGFNTVAAPSPASVGARAAAINSASHTPISRIQAAGKQEPRANGQRQSNQQQSAGEGGLCSQLSRLEFRSVVEQNQHERYLGDCPNSFASGLCVDQSPADHATGDQEDDRTVQVCPAQRADWLTNRMTRNEKTQIAAVIPPVLSRQIGWS